MINQSFCSLSVPDWIIIPPILLLSSICIQASTLASPSIYNYPSHYSSGLFYDNIYWSDILRLVIVSIFIISESYSLLLVIRCNGITILSVFNWSILNNNVKTHLFFEFRFAAFPGKTIRLSITGKSPATLILAGGHS